MSHRLSLLSRPTVIVLLLLMSVGCVNMQQPNAPHDDKARITGGLAAIAGESSSEVNTITSDDVENHPVTYTEQLLRGQIAGVEVLEKPGGGFSIRIRGSSSIYGSSEPLYVVDGMQVMNDSRLGLSWLNIHDIKKIEVLKRAGETAMYGTRGANGVVLITTKPGPEGQ